MKVIWINSWFDPGREKQATETLIGEGADVLIQNTDSTATMQTAEQKKVHAFGWDSDMKKFGPNAQLGACVSYWGVYYTHLINSHLTSSIPPLQISCKPAFRAPSDKDLRPTPPATPVAEIGRFAL